MKHIKILYLLFTFIFFSSPACWAAKKNLYPTLTVNVDNSINVTVVNPSQAVGTINSTSGACSNMAAEFKIKSNNTNSYDIGMTATANDGAVENAFFQLASGNYIALANVTSVPPSGSINAVKVTTPTQSANPNVIAYKLTDWYDPTGNLELTMTNGAGPNFTGWYYRIYKNSPGAVNGTVKITLDTNPHTNTYSTEYDGAGMYQSDVTVTAYTL